MPANAAAAAGGPIANAHWGTRDWKALCERRDPTALAPGGLARRAGSGSGPGNGTGNVGADKRECAMRRGP